MADNEPPGPSEKHDSLTPTEAPQVEVGEQGEEEADFSPFFDYLQSPQGHEVVTRVLTMVDDIKKATITHSASGVKLEKWLQVGILIVVVIASTALAVMGKFDATIGVLFGTLVGYVFGKRGN